MYYVFLKNSFLYIFTRGCVLNMSTEYRAIFQRKLLLYGNVCTKTELSYSLYSLGCKNMNYSGLRGGGWQGGTQPLGV